MHQIFKALFCSSLAIYLNSLAECAHVISSWLGERCPYYLVTLGNSGVCWSVCWFAAINLFICIAIGKIFKSSKKKRSSIYLLIIIIFIINFLGLQIIFTVLFASTIPMVGGFYQLWPTKEWEWFFAFLCFVFSVFRILYICKSKRIVSAPPIEPVAKL